jgi:hypothetical protein
MKDTVQKIAVGVILAVFSGVLGAYISDQRQPNVQLLIDRAIDLASERITVFRLRNFGGGIASGSEVRLSPKVAASDLSLVTTSPVAAISGSPVVVSVDKLKPKDGIVFFLREARTSALQPKELVESAVYDQGAVAITTLDERLESYIWQKQVQGFSVGIVVGVFLFGLILSVDRWVQKKTANKAPEPTTTSVTSPAAQEPRQP